MTKASITELEMLRDMLRLRAYDERAVALQRQGRIGPYPPFWGEEAIQVGAAWALRRGDWLFPTYRQNAVALLRGLPPEQALLYFRGDPQGFFDPGRHGCAPQCGPVATQVPHAVGWALGRRRAGRDDVALVFIGEGGTSEGDFHEGVNLAGVLSSPVVVLCTNNRWAISTPFERQTAATCIADKAIGYGIQATRVDGYDILAVQRAVADAADLARTRGRPTLIEASCYRIGPHGTPDDPDRYRDPAEAEAWRAKEPIRRFTDHLLRRGLVAQERVDALWSEAVAEMLEASRRLDSVRPADAEEMDRHVYAGAAAEQAA